MTDAKDKLKDYLVKANWHLSLSSLDDKVLVFHKEGRCVILDDTSLSHLIVNYDAFYCVYYTDMKEISTSDVNDYHHIHIRLGNDTFLII